jgi:hypothetical protein
MDVTIDVSPRRWAAALSGAVGLAGAASIGASMLSFVAPEDALLRQIRDSYIRLAWVDGEANLPAWLSAALLLLAGLLLAAIASVHRRRARQAGYWLLLSLIFVFLSLDEVAQLHELSIRPLREQFHASGFLYYPWIIPASLGVTLLAVGYSRFLIVLPSRTRWLFLFAAALYLGGSLLVEALSAMQASLHGQQTLGYHLIVTVEELLEMSGVVVFLYALLDYLTQRFPRITIHVRNSEL